MSAPAVFIVVPLEGWPRVSLVCLHDDEEERLGDSLHAGPGYLALVGRAIEWAEEELAA